jgi:hypothetical protein
MNGDDRLRPLPEAGPPFQVGDEVAFFPAEIAEPDDPGWFRWDYAVIDEVNEAAKTFRGHFLSKPGEKFAQDMNNIVRRTPNYSRWRAAMERVVAAGGQSTNQEEIELRARVLAEHPIHGGERFPHGLVVERRRSST